MSPHSSSANRIDWTGERTCCGIAGKQRKLDGFIAAAKEQGPQPAAFYTLALGSGARKGELCGLKWTDIDLDAGAVAFVRQLIKPGPEPVFGPLKNGESRTITIASETVALP